MKTTYQKLKKEFEDEFFLAEKYYALLSALNSLNMTEREIQLTAFTAIRGNISYNGYREEFCEKYGTTPATINNMISKLKKLGVLIKDNGRIKTNPAIIPNFNNNVVLEINLCHGQTS